MAWQAFKLSYELYYISKLYYKKIKREKGLMLLICPLTFNRMQSAQQEFTPSTKSTKKKDLFFVVLFCHIFTTSRTFFIQHQEAQRFIDHNCQ